MQIDFSKNNSNLNWLLINDLERKLGVDDLPSWLDEEAERLSHFGTTHAKWEVVFTDALLKERNIESISAANVSGDASISLGPRNKYEIFYKPGLPDFGPYYPRRFAVAHEIGHTYWFENAKSCKPLSSAQRVSGPDSTIEILCNRFAASLLLPKRRVSDALHFLAAETKSDVLPLPVIPVISEYFKVAERAVAQRLFFSHDPDLRAIVCLRNLDVANLDDAPLLDLHDTIPASKWVSSWCALPSGVSESRFEVGTRIPLASRKLIPFGMLPDVPSGEVCRLTVDSRWVWGATPTKYAGLKLDKIKQNDPATAFVYKSKIRQRNRVEERIYLALLRS